MFRKTFLTLSFFLLLQISGFAQIYPTQYRPPGQQWQYLNTPHFKILYARGNDTTALQIGRILEEQYPAARQLVGGQLHQFPVILNSYNDRSNGFVTPLNFRSEIELPPLKGKATNPQTGGWLEIVGPHELVHALQFSHLGEINLPRLVSLFSPDLARTFHSAIPSGMLEGIAVHHESRNVAPHGGRGNYPYFENQFDAVFKSGDRWSMGQMMQISAQTRPFNRHYIGGYAFTAWLQAEYGPSTTRKSLDFYMNFPFLGYGVALRHTTGQWPGQLYSDFLNAERDSLQNTPAEPAARKLIIPYRGKEVRRPQWISDSTLVFYGSFYNARPGFYRYDLNSDDLHRILATNSVNDYNYDLAPDGTRMVYSYYESDPIYDRTQKAEIVEYSLRNGRKRQLTNNGRVYAPFYGGGRLMALQTRPASSALVGVGPDSIRQKLSLGDHEIVSADFDSGSEQWAVIANKRGMQALWIADAGNLPGELEGPPDIAFTSGSVFDPVWHPSGQKLLFSSDFSGTLQLYEFNQQTRHLVRITNAPFNAFEASYSPDGNRIAFIQQLENEQIPYILERSGFKKEVIPAARWEVTGPERTFMQRPVVADSIVAASQNWESGSYSGGFRWLKPRMVLPVFEEVSNREVYKAGIELQSSDLLASQSYAAEASYLEERLWYGFSYRNKTFYPGFEARIYSRPSYFSYTSETPNAAVTHTLLRENRSLSLSVPIRVRLNQNVFSTSFFVEPEIRRSRFRFFEIGRGSNRSDLVDINAANLYAQFNYRLQQNIRDLQPNSGLLLFTELERYLNSGSVIFNAYNEEVEIGFERPTAINGGLYTYLSPLRRWNQSLRLGIRVLKQSAPVFDNQNLVSEGFSEPVLVGSNNLVSFSTRYTIPLLYSDNGGFLLPFYLSKIYMVAFTNSVTDPTFENWYKQSRSVFGVGIRAHFRLSNLGFDIGVGYGYEPTRRNGQFFIGDF